MNMETDYEDRKFRRADAMASDKMHQIGGIRLEQIR